jgi:hypothetical protein
MATKGHAGGQGGLGELTLELEVGEGDNLSSIHHHGGRWTRAASPFRVFGNKERDLVGGARGRERVIAQPSGHAMSMRACLSMGSRGRWGVIVGERGCMSLVAVTLGGISLACSRPRAVGNDQGS